MGTQKPISLENLSAISDKIPNTSVLVIGDIMLDRFVYGTVERISPESPVPVLAVKREEEMLGGAGNALSNLAGLQSRSHIIALTGDDSQADKISHIINTLECAGHLVKCPARPTIVKTRYLAGHQQLLRTDYERTAPVSDELKETILRYVIQIMPEVGALILSDYGKGLLREDLIQNLIAEARTCNIPVIIDPKGRDFSKYSGADFITPNKKELSEACNNCALATDSDVEKAARHLIETCGIKNIIATRSGEGISVITANSAHHIPGADIEVFDVSGAGDTVIATLGAALAAGATPVEAATIANLAGSIVVTKVGTAPIRLQELKNALQGDLAEHINKSGKDRQKTDRARKADLLNWHEAAEQIKRWKARGLRVGFTNGCFDILHYGHVNYLNEAASHCDRLVMGLNKDSSIRILKGPDRPVHSEDSRAAVIGALGSIDMVVLFGAEKEGDDNTACALLDTIKPDIYFKGGDYTIDQIPEAPTVLKNGGEVKVMPVYEGHSTTNSIEKIKKDHAA